MEQFFRYYGRYQSLRGSWGGLPGWARGIVFLFALPGIALGLLSVLTLLVSILALLLLTVPVYRLLKTVTGGGTEAGESDSIEVNSVDSINFGTASRGAKRVEATVIETREDPGPSRTGES
jgi:hypothetical protein